MLQCTVSSYWAQQVLGRLTSLSPRACLMITLTLILLPLNGVNFLWGGRSVHNFFLPQIHQQQVMRQGLKDELGLVVRAKESIIRALAIEHEDLRSIKNKFEAVIGQV